MTVDTNKYPYKDPFLSKPKDDDLTKQWVVEYGIWSQREGKLKRKRIELKGTTVQERLAHSKEVIAELKSYLKKGGYIDPIHIPAEQQKTETEAGRILPSTPLLKAIDVYLEYKKRTTKHNSYRTYRSSLNTFKKYLESRTNLKRLSLQHFHTADAIDFLDQVILKYGMTNRGHNNVKDNVSMFFRHWCERLNRPNAPVMLVNPFDSPSISDKSTTSNKHTAYTDQQRIDFRQACIEQNEEQLLLFVQFMYYTFLRPRQELRLLRVRDLKADTVHINAVDAKDNTAEHIEIAPPLQSLIEENKLRDYPPHFFVFSHDGTPGADPVGPDYFYQHHRRLLKHLKWTDQAYDMYSWKHTGVIALWNATQNIRLIQQQCRHSTAAQTEDYLRDLGIIVRHTQIQDFPEF